MINRLLTLQETKIKPNVSELRTYYELFVRRRIGISFIIDIN